jgi:hypothetical protein
MNAARLQHGSIYEADCTGRAVVDGVKRRSRERQRPPGIAQCGVCRVGTLPRYSG